MIVYRGGRRQRGYGIGGVFANFFRKIKPFLQRSAVTVGKNALDTAVNVLGDVERGGDVVKSLKKHGKSAAWKTAKQVGMQAIKRARDWDDDTLSPDSKRSRRDDSDGEFDDIFS